MRPGDFLILGYDTENLSQIMALRPFGVFLTSRFREIPEAARYRAIQNLRESLPGAWLVTDQEGGYASWLLPGYPSARELADLPPSSAWSILKRMSLELASRVDGNFAPVVDRFRQGDPVVSGKGRTFSDDPHRVMFYAWMVLQAHRHAGLVAVAKHFLAQSLAKGDPHTGESVVTAGWEELEHDLEIYRFLVRQGLRAVMAGHMRIPIGDERPVLTSSFWLGRVLRDDIGFQGVVISDDLTMGAVQDLETTVERAFFAGVDLFLVAWDREEAFARTARALEALLKTRAGRRLAETKWARIRTLLVGRL